MPMYLFSESPSSLSGLYLAVGQAANIVGVILAAPLSNQIGKKRTYNGSMTDRLGFNDILFFWLDKTDLSPDIHVPSVHQYLCR